MALLQNLQLKRGSEWLVGLDANVAAWQYTRIGVFWRWLSWPLGSLASRCTLRATWRYAIP